MHRVAPTDAHHWGKTRIHLRWLPKELAHEPDAPQTPPAPKTADATPRVHFRGKQGAVGVS